MTKNGAGGFTAALRRRSKRSQGKRIKRPIRRRLIRGQTTDKGSGADSAFLRPTPYPYAAFRLLPLFRDTISRLTATTMPSSVEITAIVFIQRRIVIRHSRVTRSSMMVWRASLLDHRFTSSQRPASTCPSQQ